ncbi:hypothetical protein KPL47_06970 [Clostridium estertheticum]|uniref:hypothetical protein n=1 Tax=Clostridium estertheticum TaxID=238834 RepID=UPI001C0E3A59|nr:hypothetical protein [Clostridium estertheticum]MBU3176109.1 hypothetical protein [Clostridium estertheticum]
MNKKVVHIKKPVRGGKLSKGVRKNMIYSNTNEMGSIIRLLARLQSLRLKVVENIATLTHNKVDVNTIEINEFEALMKECYINNAERHKVEAEESLIFANEAEEVFNKSKKEWSEF